MKKRESGQLMVMAAMGMAVFMGIAALAVDLGYAYSERRTSQNAADAAALAGVRWISLRESSCSRPAKPIGWKTEKFCTRSRVPPSSATAPMP